MISVVIPVKNGGADLVRWSVLGVAGIALSNLLIGLFAGRSDVTSPITYAALGGTASLAAAFLLVPRAGLAGATLSVAVFWPAGILGVLLVRGRGYRDVPGSPTRPLVRSDDARRLLGVGTAALFQSLLDLGTMLALRAHYVRAYGVEANGLLQAALALSQLLGAVFYAYLASYAFGKISAATAAGGVDAARTYTQRQWKPLLLLATVAIAIAMVGASPLLHLLYSTRFDGARPLMRGRSSESSADRRAHVVGGIAAGGRAPALGRDRRDVSDRDRARLPGLHARRGRGDVARLRLRGGGGVLFLVAVARMSRAGVKPRLGDVAASLLAVALVAALALLITRR